MSIMNLVEIWHLNEMSHISHYRTAAVIKVSPIYRLHYNLWWVCYSVCHMFKISLYHPEIRVLIHHDYEHWHPDITRSTKHCGWITNIPVSYLRGPGFKSLPMTTYPEDSYSFLSPSRQMFGQYLKFSQAYFPLHLSLLTNQQLNAIQPKVKTLLLNRW
jgi:hypothetical protein